MYSIYGIYIYIVYMVYIYNIYIVYMVFIYIYSQKDKETGQCPSGHYQSATGLMVTHALGHTMHDVHDKPRSTRPLADW